jgi:hemerythrin-like metal-binding protein
VTDSSTWNEGLCIDHGPIDHQHQHLLALTATISVAAKAGHVDETRDLFQRLHRDCQEHFRSEEAYMRRIQYPHREEHQQEHCRLIQHVEALLEPSLADSGQSTVSIMECIRSLVIMHILNDDLEIRHFLQEQTQG